MPGLTPAAASAVASGSIEAGARALEVAERLGGRVLILDDAEYPELLRHIPEPAPVLFALGDLGLLERPGVAIVGSRKHTPYGGEVARALAWGAASAGLAVVSGMARGLDAVAHDAALDAGGGTIGVLGNGLGVVYPAANARLYRRVAERGLLLTEFAPGERPTAGSFPRRNRLISGLARVTVVVEAAEGSGALITASSALEQGRDVMAVPGTITSPCSVGANRLIRDGAEPLLTSDDLLAHYPEAVRAAEGFASAAGTQPLPHDLPPADRALAELLEAEPVSLDELVGRSGRPPQDVLAVLCALEIAGVVEQQPGRRFRRL
ncbi:MAG TPA: DNA-processing protein DprA [Solirubrobacterales bacterium]|nr:DNA-processing protein DprA [Solirubrobacterales bacterium]